MNQLEELERAFPGTELSKMAKFILDDNVSVKNQLPHLWIQKLLGAYLSQGFVHHRVPFQFYTSLIGLKMRNGSLDEEEKEKLLDFDKKYNGKPTTNEWKELALDMGRQSKHLQYRLKILKPSKNVSQTLKNTKYTLEDEVNILVYLNEHFEIGNVEKLNSLHRNDFLPLVKVLQRHEMPIYHHFKLFLLPHVRKCLWFSEPYLNGKMTF